MPVVVGAGQHGTVGVVHELKTWPGPFEAVVAGRKPYEIRRADRPFAVGDDLHLREWEPAPDGGRSGRYTGRELVVTVLYITRGGEWGLPADMCVMGFTPPAGARGQAS